MNEAAFRLRVQIHDGKSATCVSERYKKPKTINASNNVIIMMFISEVKTPSLLLDVQ